jgi:hypothetical protein
MEYYAGIDVSLNASSVCVVDGKGQIVQETKVASESEALSRFFAELVFPVTRIGLEAGPLSSMAWPSVKSRILASKRPRLTSPTLSP